MATILVKRSINPKVGKLNARTMNEVCCGDPYIKFKVKALTQSSLYANCFCRKSFSCIDVFVLGEIVLDQSLTFSEVLDDKSFIQHKTAVKCEKCHRMLPKSLNN